MDDYLAGVAAEPLHAREALGHYLDALRGRPDLFWAHYRAAVVACRLDEYPARGRAPPPTASAASPENPALHVHARLGPLSRSSATRPDDRGSTRWPRPSRECDRALELDPDFAEAYQIRAMIRQASGQDEGVRADVDRFALLTRFRGPARALTLRLGLEFHPGPNYAAALRTRRGARPAGPGRRPRRSRDPGDPGGRAGPGRAGPRKPSRNTTGCSTPTPTT